MRSSLSSVSLLNNNSKVDTGIEELVGFLSRSPLASMKNRAPESAGAPPLREEQSDATVDFKVCEAKLEGKLCTVSGTVAGFDLCEVSWVLETLLLSGNGKKINFLSDTDWDNFCGSKELVAWWQMEATGNH